MIITGDFDTEIMMTQDTEIAQNTKLIQRLTDSIENLSITLLTKTDFLHCGLKSTKLNPLELHAVDIELLAMKNIVEDIKTNLQLLLPFAYCKENTHD